LIAYCAAQRGDFPLAFSEIRHAIRDDPDYWRYRYDLALMLAADGRDGVPAARAAAALNPREVAAAVAPRVLAGSNARLLARQQLTSGQ
jgi:Flp pilus assembly protein TadD